MMKEGHKINMVVPGSLGDELELEPGDRVLAVND
ncbi:MAG: PDZ domain-containing protein, partial [Frisingicoccus sp.]